MSNIIRNAMQTPDGTIIESRHRHDYIGYEDANGKTYVVDGGLDYFRQTVHKDAINLNVTLDDGHEVVRDAMTWGTYGINGDQPLTYIKLKDMDTAHIKAVLELGGVYPQIKKAMRTELKYRSDK